MSSLCGLPTQVWRTESTTFPTLLEAPSNFIVPALFKLTGVVFHGALWLPRGFASDDGWRDVKSNSQQIECTICTESKLASSCAALLLCSRCLQYELEKNKQSIKCRFLGDSVKFVVLWPPHRSLEHPIYDFSNPTWGAVKLHCLGHFKTWCNIPASSNVCKIIASSGSIAGGIFSASEQFFAFLSFCMRLPVLKRRKNPTKRRKKSRAQNSETETRKKMDTAKISATGDNCCCFGFRAIILHRWIIQEWYSNSPDRKSKPSRF